MAALVDDTIIMLHVNAISNKGGKHGYNMNPSGDSNKDFFY